MAPILAAVLWFMDRHLQGLWWLYVWILLSLVQIFIAAIFPVFLLPLFNKLTPLEEGRLKQQILALAQKINFRLSGIYTMDGSKRSSHSNAFFAGLGKLRRIVLFDTLVKSLTESELLAVLAHEMGHNVKKHVRTGLHHLFLRFSGRVVCAFIAGQQVLVLRSIPVCRNPPPTLHC